MDTLHRYVWLLLLVVSMQGMAQSKKSVNLSASDKAYLEEVALARVGVFQENCAKVADKSKPKSLKLTTIEETIKLFVDGKRTIQITDSDGSVQPPKRISIYMNRLMILGYKRIDITSSDFHISTHLKPSASMNAKHPGEDWYEGVVSVLQRFTGHGDFSYTDVVKRNFTVYFQRTEVTEGLDQGVQWALFIGDIQAQTVSSGR